MLTDPLSVTYDGSTKTLPRVSAGSRGTVYRTADGELEVSISRDPSWNGNERRSVKLSRTSPDPTPENVFDGFRNITNSFTISYEFDPSRFELSDELPRLRAALLNLLDVPTQGRIISGEM
jgi:hypothetical protein